MTRPPPSTPVSFLVLLLALNGCNAQFGEIASIVTGLLGSAPALGSLGSLAGAGAAAGSAGAAGASGVASALGNVGQLYQLAQAALQLTGTGVGIVNQASESAWFPAAVENAARMNRDFQDRLIAQQKTGGKGLGLPDLLGTAARRPGTAGVGTVKEIDELGGEFGKEFGSHETGTDEEDKSTTKGEVASSTAKSKSTDEDTDQSRIPIPGLSSLLPGEVPSGKHIEEEEVAEETPAQQLVAPRITVELPEESLAQKDAKSKPSVQFSVDSNEDNFPLIPPKAQSPSEDSQGAVIQVDGKNIQHMVPELRNLINALRKSNLTSDELRELTKQLETNHDIGEPRENTTPAPTEPKTREPESDIERQEQETKQKAVHRNLSALRRALNEKPESHAKLFASQDSAPVIIKLNRPMISNEVKTLDPARAFAAPRHSAKWISTGNQKVTQPSVPSSTSSPRPIAQAAKNRVNVSPNPIPPNTLPPVPATPAPATQPFAQYQQQYQQYYQQYYSQQPQYNTQQQQGLFQPQPHVNPFYTPHFYQHQPAQAAPPVHFQYQVQYPAPQQPQLQPQPQYPAQPQPQYSAQAQYPAQHQIAAPPPNRAFPARTVAPSVVTPAPGLLQHPWSQGILLTIPQPHDMGK